MSRSRARRPRVRLLNLEPKAHETTPPARFTEASLIKELERIGVGRPSTFAATIGTIERRGYVFRQGKALVPSFTAFAVTSLLREHFGDLVDIEFTAEMEEDLDQISRGEREWLDFIKQFYRGDRHHRGLEDAVKQAEETADYPLIDVGLDPESGSPIKVRIGRYGPFLQLGEGGPGKTAGLPPSLPPADLTVEKAMTLIRAKAEGPRRLGVDPKTGQNVYAIHGRFGAYVQLGETPEKGAKEKPKRSSLVGSQTESTITLDEALKLLELPRELGVHPETTQPIVAGLGGSVRTSNTATTIDRSKPPTICSRSISSARSRCWPRRSGPARQAAKRVIRTIEVPGGGAALQVLEGRYGPYVTDGEVNASVPEGTDPGTLSLDDARALLEARRSAAPSPRRSKRGSAAAPRGRARAAARPNEQAAVSKGKAKVKAKPTSTTAAAGTKRPARKRAS